MPVQVDNLGSKLTVICERYCWNCWQIAITYNNGKREIKLNNHSPNRLVSSFSYPLSLAATRFPISD
jgi:hypothetical protein